MFRRQRLSPEAMRILMDYEWPGNVRELENAMERGVVLATTRTITSDLLPASLTGNTYSASLLEHVRTPLFDIHGGDRAAHHQRQAGTLPLEPDRGGGVIPDSALAR